MINIASCDTVLLDMDGTLLDLNFDNRFWLEFVPERYAQKHRLTLDEAKQILAPRFKALVGQLEWYCLDYWTQQLRLDIVGLKIELAGLIAVLPHVIEFLEALRATRRQVLLVTNAHPQSLHLKMEKTCLQPFFDGIVSSHEFGIPKEQPEFWSHLQKVYPFDKQRTLLIDDSLAVLQSAQTFGIEHLLTISKPDSQQPLKESSSFPAIADFRELVVLL